jgi:hypothetical protein
VRREQQRGGDPCGGEPVRCAREVRRPEHEQLREQHGRQQRAEPQQGVALLNTGSCAAGASAPTGFATRHEKRERCAGGSDSGSTSQP